MPTLQEEKPTMFAYGFGTESARIIREYSQGLTDGFLNDLAQGHAGPHPSDENELKRAFLAYVAQFIS